MIHVYTGNGKGKSTAAFGLALRAAGHGLRVKIIQFMKSEKMFNVYGEVKFMRKLDNVEVRQFGTDGWVDPAAPAPEAISAAARAAEAAFAVMKAKSADVLVLDEILYAYKFKLISSETLEKIMSEKPPAMELVLTGRDAPEFVVEKADLVTEMREIKHYFKSRGAVEGVEF